MKIVANMLRTPKKNDAARSQGRAQARPQSEGPRPRPRTNLALQLQYRASFICSVVCYINNVHLQ